MEEEEEGLMLMSGRDGRGGGGRGGRSRHTQCTFMEIHCNFSPKILLFHFSKNVSVYYQPSFHYLLSFQCPYHRSVHGTQESNTGLSTLNTSARLSNVNLVSDTASSISHSSYPALVWNQLCPSSCILLISML